MKSHTFAFGTGMKGLLLIYQHKITTFGLAFKKTMMKESTGNRNKRLIIIRNSLLTLCFLIFTLTALFPPWNAVVNPFDHQENVSMGYHFIATPPHSPYGFESYIILNYARIMVQWGVLLLLSMGIYKYLNRQIRPTNSQNER